MNEVPSIKHTSTKFNEEIEDIRQSVFQMAGLIEKQTQRAIQALMDYDANLADKLIEREVSIDELESKIDQMCVETIAKRQPTAFDLRFLIAVAKITTDLERIGDEAEDMGGYLIKMKRKKSAKFHSDLSTLGKIVMEMMNQSFDSFARLDDSLARKAISKELKLQKEFDRVMRVLVTYMMEDPRTIKAALKVAWCARSLERIGKHCSNVCEYIVYLVEGKDIRHQQD